MKIEKEKLAAIRIMSLWCDKCIEAGQSENEIQPTKCGV
jgi:hypothetical protein